MAGNLLDRRLNMELKKLQEEETKKKEKGETPEMVAMIVNENMRHWLVVVEGSPDTPFQKGKFILDVQFTDSYPYQPPRVYFRSKMFHPNVGTSGNICVDILNSNWSPALKTEHLIRSIVSLMNEPNASDPLNREAATLYKDNRAAYNKKIEDIVKDHGTESAVKDLISKIFSEPAKQK